MLSRVLTMSQVLLPTQDDEFWDVLRQLESEQSLPPRSRYEGQPAQPGDVGLALPAPLPQPQITSADSQFLSSLGGEAVVQQALQQAEGARATAAVSAAPGPADMEIAGPIQRWAAAAEDAVPKQPLLNPKQAHGKPQRAKLDPKHTHRGPTHTQRNINQIRRKSKTDLCVCIV